MRFLDHGGVYLTDRSKWVFKIVDVNYYVERSWAIFVACAPDQLNVTNQVEGVY